MLLPFALLMENQWWVKFLVSFQELRQWKQIVLSVVVLSTVMHLLKKKPVSLKNILHAAAAAKSLQSCPTLCDPKDGSPPAAWWLPRPWDSPGKNTGVGCHFLLQCMKVKSESEVAQSCLTLRDPMGCSLPGSSVHGIFQARVLEWGAIAFSILHEE